MASAPLDLSSAGTAQLARPRAFGSSLRDLDIDFTVSDRVDLAIRVVAEVSGSEPDLVAARAQASALPIGVRILQMLYLVASIEDTLALARKCPLPGCGQPIELALPLQALIDHGTAPPTRRSCLKWVCQDKGAPITLRRPTGNDQLAWRQRRYGSQDEATRHLLQTLVLEESGRLTRLTPREQERIAEAMAEFDPLVVFRITTRCPSCGEEATFPLDLEDACLARLHRHQRSLLEAVHRLASAYGWTEQTILQLPAGRRDFYLERVEAMNAGSLR